MCYRHQHLNTKSEAERFHTTGSHEPLKPGFQILDFRASGIVVKTPRQENPAHGQRGRVLDVFSVVMRQIDREVFESREPEHYAPTMRHEPTAVSSATHRSFP